MRNKLYNLSHEFRLPRGFLAQARKRTKIGLRKFFEHKRIHQILGTNLAFMVLAGSVMPWHTYFPTPQAEQVAVTHAKEHLTTEKGIQAPLSGYVLTQPYRLFHPGVDLAAPKGTLVHPIMAGRVVIVLYQRFDYGNHIIVNHGNGLTSLYAHLSKINVKVGDEVKNDTVIGEVGSTGHSTGNHLHLEIRDDERPINPTSVLNL